MATAFTAQIQIPADPAGAFAKLSDQAYVTAVAEASGATDITVTVEATPDGGATVTSARAIPTADLPSAVRDRMGEKLPLTEVRTFGPAAADGSRTGTIAIEFDGAPVKVTGDLKLAAGGTGSTLDVDSKAKASIPFVGGMIERFIVEQLQKFVTVENETAAK